MIRPDSDEAPHGGSDEGSPRARRSNARAPRFSEHDRAHTAALHALLASAERPGDRELDAQERESQRESQRVVESCPECSDEFARLLELQQRLDDAGRSRAAVLEAARRSQLAGLQPAGAELVAPFVRAQLQQRRRPVRLRLVGPLIATAAAALVLVGWWMRSWLERAESSSRGVVLGDRSSSSLKPNGPVEQYGAFEWTAVPLPAGGSYCLRVWDPIKGSPDDPLYKSPLIQETSWLVDLAETASWPDVIEWEVQTRDATGYDSGSPRFARASRLPR